MLANGVQVARSDSEERILATILAISGLDSCHFGS